MKHNVREGYNCNSAATAAAAAWFVSKVGAFKLGIRQVAELVEHSCVALLASSKRSVVGVDPDCSLHPDVLPFGAEGEEGRERRGGAEEGESVSVAQMDKSFNDITNADPSMHASIRLRLLLRYRVRVTAVPAS